MAESCWIQFRVSCCKELYRRQNAGRRQPRPQGLLGVQNCGSHKTLANSRSRVSKSIGDFDCFNLYDWLIYGHVVCCLPGFSPSRHFERREDPGNEVGATVEGHEMGNI